MLPKGVPLCFTTCHVFHCLVSVHQQAILSCKICSLHFVHASLISLTNFTVHRLLLFCSPCGSRRASYFGFDFNLRLRQKCKPKALVLSASAKIRRSKNAKKQSVNVFFFLAPLLRSQERLAETCTELVEVKEFTSHSK